MWASATSVVAPLATFMRFHVAQFLNDVSSLVAPRAEEMERVLAIAAAHAATAANAQGGAPTIHGEVASSWEAQQQAQHGDNLHSASASGAGPYLYTQQQQHPVRFGFSSLMGVILSKLAEADRFDARVRFLVFILLPTLLLLALFLKLRACYYGRSTQTFVSDVQVFCEHKPEWGMSIATWRKAAEEWYVSFPRFVSARARLGLRCVCMAMYAPRVPPRLRLRQRRRPSRQ
jgi:hypothetical protein